MPIYSRLPSYKWRVQVRRQGHHVSRTFRTKREAEEWGRDQETRIDRGETPIGASPLSRDTFGDIVDLHFADLHELRIRIRSSLNAPDESVLKARCFGASGLRRRWA